MGHNWAVMGDDGEEVFQRCSDGQWVSQILVHSNPTEGVFYAAIQIILGTV